MTMRKTELIGMKVASYSKTTTETEEKMTVTHTYKLQNEDKDSVITWKTNHAQDIDLGQTVDIVITNLQKTLADLGNEEPGPSEKENMELAEKLNLDPAKKKTIKKLSKEIDNLGK
jgi:hypothetical protein